MGSHMDRILVKKCVLTEKKVVEIGARIKHSP
jgi:hypothetical protein